MLKNLQITRMRFKTRLKYLKNDAYALYLASKDPRVPVFAKAWVILVIGYALSPIDLIPDFIPILGQLDDLIIVPFGFYIAYKMIPPYVIEEYRYIAKEKSVHGLPKSWVAAIVILLIWLVILFFLLRWFFQLLF